MVSKISKSISFVLQLKVFSHQSIIFNIRRIKKRTRRALSVTHPVRIDEVIFDVSSTQKRKKKMSKKQLEKAQHSLFPQGIKVFK